MSCLHALTSPSFWILCCVPSCQSFRGSGTDAGWESIELNPCCAPKLDCFNVVFSSIPHFSALTFALQLLLPANTGMSTLLVLYINVYLFYVLVNFVLELVIEDTRKCVSSVANVAVLADRSVVTRGGSTCCMQGEVSKDWIVERNGEIM